MALESIADVETLHAAFVKSLNTTEARLLKLDKPDPKVLLADKRQLLADLNDRLRAATDGRAEAVGLYDRQIAQLENAIATTQGELKTDERVITRMSRAAGGTARASAAGAARKKRAK
jgi:low affinity Fe/Cu permease